MNVKIKGLKFLLLFLENISLILLFIILLIFFHFNELWQQATWHIMEEDILNYSATVVFRGTLCIYVTFSDAKGCVILHILFFSVKYLKSIV